MARTSTVWPRRWPPISTRRRFLDLGLTPGTEIYPELKNFFGDPSAYRVRGTLIAMCKNQAAQIWVKPVN